MNTESLSPAGSTELAAPMQTSLGIFDRQNFGQLCDISAKLAQSSLIPVSLKGRSIEETASNCLLVVEQSQRWGLSPFAVMQCASVVHGRLMWEGKLVAAVIEAKLGIRLNYEYSGEGENKSVTVTGKFADEEKTRSVWGSVKTWRTTHNGSPWEKPEAHGRMLAYRGAREWARLHAPGIMLGIITDDEEITHSESTIRNVTPAKPLNPFESKPAEAEVKEMPDAQTDEEVSDDRDLFTVVCVEQSSGTKRSGQSWTRYRVHLDGENCDSIIATTFSGRVGEIAQSLEGKLARATYTEDEKGYKLESIEPATAQKEETSTLF